MKERQMTTANERMAEDLAEGYHDVTRGLARMTKHLGADAGDAVSQSAAAFVHAAADLAEKMKTQAEVLAKKAGQEVREHPIATAAVAAAAVGLLGYAITHTRHAKREA
jgi:ElaB/YqjD/DUF883 family membrane-anchored ribosome-binding protein